MVGFVTKALAATGLLASSVLAQGPPQVDPIVIKGSKFFYKTNGTQFYLKGVAYQPGATGNGSVSSGTSGAGADAFVDPLADVGACKRDIPLLQGLQTNTIRVYAIDPTKDHSECMMMLQQAGIYVLSDLSDPADSIDQLQPAWNDQLFSRYTSVIDALANYTNVLGFFGGNEVAIAPNSSYAAAFVKAAVRDSKAYIQQKRYRPIGVGYATADVDIRIQLADFFNCGDPSTIIDFWGYNIYEWCGDSTYEQSGYAARQAELANYSVPSFFAEYGCNTVQPRDFTEVPVLYGDNMTQVFSGGIVYMYFEETNNFGLVTVDGSGQASTLGDYNSLQSQIATVSPTMLNSNSYTPTNTAQQQCPTTDQSWAAVATPLPPPVNPQLCSCMYESLSCVPNPSLATDQYEKLFNTVCGLGKGVCNGITANLSQQNFYGDFSVCNDTQRLGFAFNQYAQGQTNNPSACDFSGAATTQNAAKATGVCANLLNEAGTAGSGTVTGGSVAAGSTSKGVAGSVAKGTLEFGSWQLGVYVVVAMMTGAGMMLL